MGRKSGFLAFVLWLPGLLLICPPSALLRQIEGLHERRMAGSS